MRIKDLKKYDDEKYILIDGGGEVYEVEVDYESESVVWLKVLDV